MHHPKFTIEVLNDISVYTQNIWGFPNIFHAKVNLQSLLSSIQLHQPKIILLQEVFREKWLKANSKLYSDYTPFYIKKRMFVEGGLVILLHNSMTNLVKELGFEFNLSFTEFENQGLLRSKQAISRISKKGYLTLAIKDPNSQYIFRIVNTHTTSSFNKRKDQINQKAIILIQQLNQLFEFLDTVCRESDLVVGGDFNYDIVELMPEGTCKYSVYPANKEVTLPKHNQSIDFVFTNLEQNFDYKVIIPGYNKYSSRRDSDHNGVLIMTK